MTSATLIPVCNDKKLHPSSSRLLSNRYSIFDHGQGTRTYSYEFDLAHYEPEQITVLLDDSGRLRIRASRSPCQEFKREYHLGGPTVETRLVRNTLDPQGRLRVDIDVQPRREDSPPTTSQILTFDLQGYQPKHVNIRVNEHGMLKITAQHHDNRFEHHIDREYYRQYQLAKDIHPDQVRAKMDENQILTIVLPKSLIDGKDTWGPYNETPYPNTCFCNLM